MCATLKNMRMNETWVHGTNSKGLYRVGQQHQIQMALFGTAQMLAKHGPCAQVWCPSVCSPYPHLAVILSPPPHGPGVQALSAATSLPRHQEDVFVILKWCNVCCPIYVSKTVLSLPHSSLHPETLVSYSIVSDERDALNSKIMNSIYLVVPFPCAWLPTFIHKTTDPKYVHTEDIACRCSWIVNRKRLEDSQSEQLLGIQMHVSEHGFLGEAHLCWYKICAA